MPVQERELAELYRQHRSALIWQLRCCGASAADADDAVQEAFACALRAGAARAGSAGQVRDPRAWPAWLRTVALRCYLRSIALRFDAGRAGAVVKVISVADVPDAVAAPELADRDLGAEERTVLELLAALPPRQRRVFALHYEGWKTAEIAAQFGMSEPAVRQNIARARSALKELLAQRQIRLGGGS